MRIAAADTGDAQDVVAGDYLSSINISNPNDESVVFTKELVFAQEETISPCKPSSTMMKLSLLVTPSAWIAP